MTFYFFKFQWLLNFYFLYNSDNYKTMHTKCEHNMTINYFLTFNPNNNENSEGMFKWIQ